jgi:hypothetical protein
MLRGHYKTCEISVEARTMMGHISSVLELNERTQLDRTTILGLWKDAGYRIPARTLGGYMDKARDGVPIFSTNKATGAVPKFTSDHVDITVGMLYNRYLGNKQTKWAFVYNFVHNDLGVHISEKCINQVLGSLGVRSKLGKMRGQKDGGIPLELAEEAFDWNVGLHASGFLDIPPHKLWSFDTTYSQNWRDDRGTLAFKGLPSPQLKYSMGAHFTNAFCTAYSGGGAFFPVVWAGFDPKMNPADLANNEVLSHLMSEYNVEEWQLAFEPRGPKDKRTYLRENLALFSYCMRNWEVPADSHWLSDQNRAVWFLKEHEEDVFLEFAADHKTYPASGHHILQVNDDPAHMIGKNNLRAAKGRGDIQTEQEANFRYIWELCNIDSDLIIEAFDQHMCLSFEPSLEHYHRLFSSETKRGLMTEYYQACHAKYVAFIDHQHSASKVKKSRDNAFLRVEEDGVKGLSVNLMDAFEGELE